MRKSKNEKVQLFLDQIAMIEGNKYTTLNAMREIVFNTYPETEEKIMYGGIIFSLETEDYGGLFVYKNHISFEFSDGYKFEDRKKLLEGNGKFRRHLKLRSLNDIRSKELPYFIKQIKEIEK